MLCCFIWELWGKTTQQIGTGAGSSRCCLSHVFSQATADWATKAVLMVWTASPLQTESCVWSREQLTSSLRPCFSPWLGLLSLPGPLWLLWTSWSFSNYKASSHWWPWNTLLCLLGSHFPSQPNSSTPSYPGWFVISIKSQAVWLFVEFLLSLLLTPEVGRQHWSCVLTVSWQALCSTAECFLVTVLSQSAPLLLAHLPAWAMTVLLRAPPQVTERILDSDQHIGVQYIMTTMGRGKDLTERQSVLSTLLSCRSYLCVPFPKLPTELSNRMIVLKHGSRRG